MMCIYKKEHRYEAVLDYHKIINKNVIKHT
jgi:hypothetical protein